MYANREVEPPGRSTKFMPVHLPAESANSRMLLAFNHAEGLISHGTLLSVTRHNSRPSARTISNGAAFFLKMENMLSLAVRRD